MPGMSCQKDKLPDANGTILDKIILKDYEDNLVLGTESYSYSSQNKLIAITNIAPVDITNNNPGSVDSIFLEYDGQGRLLKSTNSNMVGGNIFSYTFIYDSNGNIVKKVGTPILANLSLDNYSYAYNTQGNIIADSQYYGITSSIVAYNTFSYNADDNINEVSQYENNDGSLIFIGKITYQYDKNGNPYAQIGIPLFLISDNIKGLSKNNQTSEIINNRLIAAPNYSYYSNGLPRKAIYGPATDLNAKTIEFFYRNP